MTNHWKRGKEFWNGPFVPNAEGLTLTPSNKTERNSFAISVLSTAQGRSYDFSEGSNTASNTGRATFTYGVRKFVTEIHARRRTKYVVYKSQWMPILVPRAFLRLPSAEKNYLRLEIKHWFFLAFLLTCSFCLWWSFNEIVENNKCRYCSNASLTHLNCFFCVSTISLHAV